MRFEASKIYRKLGSPFDDESPEFDCVMPVEDDNGHYTVVDCWIVNRWGGSHPGYSISPVPILVDRLGELASQELDNDS